WRRSSDAGAMLCFFAKPSTALLFELTGPSTSCSESSPSARTSRITTASLRGVANCCFEAARSFRRCRTISATSCSANASPSSRRDLGGNSSVKSSTSRLAVGGALAGFFLTTVQPRILVLQHREPELLARIEVSLRDEFRERSHAAYVGLALGHRDRAARIEQVEGVRALQHHLVARQRQSRLDQALRLRFIIVEL